MKDWDRWDLIVWLVLMFLVVWAMFSCVVSIARMGG